MGGRAEHCLYNTTFFRGYAHPPNARNAMTAAVLYDQEGPIVTMTLNRPEALNSINRQLKQELNEAIVRFDRDEGARVAIITGAGRAFCAGRDLKERAADNAAGVQAV